MLQYLSIRNFALIEKTEIHFSKGFSVITGETGAGKSILLGALGHVLGKRADLSSLKDKEEKCVIEAHFDISGYGLRPFFDGRDLDYEEVTILRREILPSGKSRAFVNDSPVTLPDLQDLGSFLIDIHSQQQTRVLSEEEFQLEVLDALSGNRLLLDAFAEQLKQLRSDKKEKLRLEEILKHNVRDADYNTYLLKELQEANLSDGQQEELEATLGGLSNAEAIKEAFGKASDSIYNEEIGIRKQLRDIRSSLQKIVAFHPDYAKLLERITESEIEIGDIARDMDQLSGKISDDPKALERVEEQLRVIYDLQRKHHVGTVAELLDIRQKLETEVSSGEELQEAISKLESLIASAEKEMEEKASVIRAKRSAAIPSLKEKLEASLSQLGMPYARFDIELTESATFRNNGKDDIRFLFSANKGSAPGLLAKTASGGEMSRIMLSVKALLSQYQKLPTIIFDEIDTGVSGEIANRMGAIMQEMGEGMQVISITHLPQIAARGAQHFRVFKATEGEQTVSGLELLSDDSRVLEIAEMLSGKSPSDSAINHAKALLN